MKTPLNTPSRRARRQAAKEAGKPFAPLTGKAPTRLKGHTYNGIAYGTGKRLVAQLANRGS